MRAVPDFHLGPSHQDVASSLLVGVLRNHGSALGLPTASWELLIRVARSEGLLARIATQLDELGVMAELPQKLRDHLSADKALGLDHDRMVRWELHHIRRAVECLPGPVVLLKGAAYVAAKLPPARGRFVADVDVLVPRSQLPFAEAAFRSRGWEPVIRNDYDQSYYRRWMHEIPPLRHRQRQTILDVHHTILPLTSRLKPDPELLFEAARPIPGERPFHCLAPADMVLHSAAHLFHDGDLDHGLRNLVDLDDLLRTFDTAEEHFWSQLVIRARQLNLQRPLFYALRYCKRYLDTPVPSDLEARGLSQVPRPVVFGMDWLTRSAMLPGNPDRRTLSRPLAEWILYLRSHLLRMPLKLLIPHLTRKALRRKNHRPRQASTEA